MFTNRDFKGQNMFDKLLHFLSVNAKAEGEPTPPTPPVVPPATDPKPEINFEHLIASARKEEKDKLYPQIQKAQEELKAMVKQSNANLLRIGELEAEVARLSSGTGESETVKALNATITTLKAENETLKTSTVDEAAIRAQIEAEYEIKLYLKEKLTENKDNVLDVFVGAITGTTKEEIDSSVAKAVENTLAIKKQLGVVDEEGKPTKPVAKKPPLANPKDGGDTGAITDIDYIKGLDPLSDEYKAWRKKVGIA